MTDTMVLNSISFLELTKDEMMAIDGGDFWNVAAVVCGCVLVAGGAAMLAVAAPAIVTAVGAAAIGTAIGNTTVALITVFTGVGVTAMGYCG